MFRHAFWNRTPMMNADTGGGAGGGTGSGQNQPSQTQPYAVFQSEADLKSRMDSAGAAKLESLARELGFTSVDEMKAAAKAQKEADDKTKSDLEKANERATRLENEKKAALETANRRLIDAEIKLAAHSAGFIDPADAVALVERTGIKLDDAGNITGVKEAVEALVKSKPHLAGKAGGVTIGGGSNPGAGQGPTPEEIGRQIAEARNRRSQPTAAGFNPWSQQGTAPANAGNTLQQLVDLLKGGR
ncbi:hypothetical protein GJ688_01995 [Heliobacillus mobilis]|uniref:Phage minor structural protein GP20 n=1 Tax=Heliobacterium mobile TaxID=28064 RepID=A0A6I3SG46_HELMO|nr:hypothetical protein [Heliobacterium mobile]MTV47754.1 hypothetical protein [Heliobacterium mobile]